MMKVAKTMDLAGIVILGDFCDFYSVSSHSKDPGRALKFEYELRQVDKKLRELNSLGAKHRVFVEGNHEDRLLRYLRDTAPALHSVIRYP